MIKKPDIKRILLLALAVSFCVSLTASWVCLLLLLLVALVSGDRASRFRSLARAPLLWPLMAFCLCIFISGLPNGGLVEAMKSLATTRGLLVYLIAYQSLHAGAGSRAMLNTLLVCGAVSGLFAVIQQVFNFHPFTYPYLQATGFLGDPMSFAGLMQLTSFLALGLSLGGRRGSDDRFLWPGNPWAFRLMVLANFLGLIFASERSAWLGMLVALPIVFLYVSPRLFWRGSLVLILASLLAWSFVPVVKTRLASLAHLEQDVSVKARLIVWSKGWQTFQEHPWLGVGARNFPHIDMPEAIVPDHSKDLNHAHNNYLQVLATTGVVGFAAFLVLLIAALCLAYRQAGFASFYQGGIGLGLFGALVSLSVAGLFEYNFGSGQVKLVQWCLLALLNFKLEPASGLITPTDQQALDND